MADRLYLSYRLAGYNARTVVTHFEKLVKAFPYSKLSRGATTLRVNAVSAVEPPLFEQSFDDPPDAEGIVAAARQFAAADCGLYVDTRWDVWQYDTDWRLAPANVTMAAFAPEFDSGFDDHLRIDFGIDALFLPQPELPNHLFMVRSNVRSLLHLVHELDRSFGVEERRLSTESGENFAARLQAALEESNARQR